MNAAAHILQRLNALATCTEQPGEITRRFLTPAHAESITLVRAWMEEVGLATQLDASGTLVGVRPGPTADAPALLLGSHIDTVRNAGRFDGCLGVAMAIEAAGALRHHTLPYTLEIRAFGDEEGVRFPVTLTGAKATAGQFNPSALDATDADGSTLRQALENFGLDPAALLAGACTARNAVAYLEVHIEQGPMLEAANTPLGIVTAINGAARFTVSVTGRAGHAGTVPMHARQDALAAASAMILAVRDTGRATPHLVATVGTISVGPGAINVIPGACSFTIDLRAPDDSVRATAEQIIRKTLQAIAEAEKVTVDLTKTHEAPATQCDDRLQTHVAQALAAHHLPTLHLPSGAGHDAMAIAALCPVAMLFVRCTGGISHHPDECVTEPDIQAALDVLIHALKTFTPQTLDQLP
jgi:allantoate deiminase